MRQNSGPRDTAEKHVRDIRRATRKKYSTEDKIRIVLSGLRGEYSIAELCRREGIAESLYYSWSKEFLEAGKKRLAGDTERQASSGEVKDLRRETSDLKELVAELTLENRLLKKTNGPPRLQAIFSRVHGDQSASTYPASERSTRPRWRYARPGPHKHSGGQPPFF
jgi:transposase